MIRIFFLISVNLIIILTLHGRLLVAFFGRSVSLYPAYFQLKPSLHELEL